MAEIRSDRWYYANTAAGFQEDIRKGDYISDLLESRFVERWGFEPSISLLHSWQESPQAFAKALEKGYVKRDEIVVLEYCLDQNHRIDALVGGMYKEIPNIVIVEMKRWHEYQLRECEGDDMLEMKFPHAWIQVEHPSAQALRYKMKMMEIFNAKKKDGDSIDITPYSFLHKCHELSDDQLKVLRGEKFGDLFDKVPIYTDVYKKAMGNRIHEKTRHQDGLKVLGILENL